MKQYITSKYPDDIFIAYNPIGDFATMVNQDETKRILVRRTIEGIFACQALWSQEDREFKTIQDSLDIR